MKKRVLSLALALVLCLGLTAPVAAADLAIELYENGNFYDLNYGQAASGGGWSWSGSKLTLNGFQGDGSLWCTLNHELTISLAPGSVNQITNLTLKEGSSNTLSIEGSGTLIIDARTLPDDEGGPLSFAPGTKMTLKNGLAVTGGAGETDTLPITINEDGYAQAGGSRWVGYARIAPGSGSGTKTLTASIQTVFNDVPANSPYAEAVQWAVERRITKGKTATTFGPNDTCTVFHILLFMFRNEYPGAIPSLEYGEAGETWNWAIENIITPRPDDSDYSMPDWVYNTPCTRAMAVTYMWKAAGSPTPKKMVSFSDVPASASYAKAVSWAVEQGITKGTTPTTFSPSKTCTRGQIVTFLYRANK